MLGLGALRTAAHELLLELGHARNERLGLPHIPIAGAAWRRAESAGHVRQPAVPTEGHESNNCCSYDTEYVVDHKNTSHSLKSSPIDQRGQATSMTPKIR